MHTLIIGTAPAIVVTLFAYLEARGHVLDAATRGDVAISLATQQTYDAIALESSMPDALGLCAQLNALLGGQCPLLMLGGSGAEQELVAAFANGADDYLPRCCVPAEVEARLKALDRRAKGLVCKQRPLQVGALTFDAGAFVARRAGKLLPLTRTGYALLACLMRAAPKVVSRAELISEVWGDAPPETDALRVHMHALRRALDKPFDYPMLRTLNGIGYQLVARDEQD